MKAEEKSIMINIMEYCIDKVMYKYDFKRRGNSFNYIRSIGTTTQKVEMICYFHPSYCPGMLAHIYPWLSVYYPEIDRVSKSIVDDTNIAISNRKDTTLRQPIQIYSDSERWTLMTNRSEEVHTMAEKIGIFLEQYTIPLLDDLKTVDDYINKYVQQDKKIIKDDFFYFYVACAYVSKEEYVKGLEVLEYRFGKPGLRKKYSNAFQFFEKKLEQ